MVKNIDTTHALVINTNIIVAIGNREEMFEERKKLKAKGESSQVYLFPNGIIGNSLGY